MLYGRKDLPRPMVSKVLGLSLADSVAFRLVARQMHGWKTQQRKTEEHCLPYGGQETARDTGKVLGCLTFQLGRVTF